MCVYSEIVTHHQKTNSINTIHTIRKPHQHGPPTPVALNWEYFEYHCIDSAHTIVRCTKRRLTDKTLCSTVKFPNPRSSMLSFGHIIQSPYRRCGTTNQASFIIVALFNKVYDSSRVSTDGEISDCGIGVSACELNPCKAPNQTM